MSDNTAVVILRFSDDTCKVKAVSNIYNLYWNASMLPFDDGLNRNQISSEFYKCELMDWVSALMYAANLFMEFPREHGIQIIESPFTWEECVRTK